jgi:hypothetical protein
MQIRSYPSGIESNSPSQLSLPNPKLYLAGTIFTQSPWQGRAGMTLADLPGSPEFEVISKFTPWFNPDKPLYVSQVRCQGNKRRQ